MSLSTVIANAQMLLEGAREARAAANAELAFNLCHQALGLEPDNVMGLALLAELQGERGEWTAVLNTLDKMDRLSPGQARAALQRGVALLNLKRTEEALDAFEEAAMLDPYNAKAWRGRGEILQSLGREDEARESFARAADLALEMDDVRVCVNI